MKNATIERRWLGDYKGTSLEVRAADDDNPERIVGHAAVFNRTSQNLGGFVEEVRSGAFTKTIGEADVRGLFNHDANLVLGRNINDTLVLSEDNVGLAYDILPPDTTTARDLLVLMRRGDITQSSFAFRAVNVEWGLTDDDFPKRSLVEAALYDVSPVTYPAYLAADSGVSRNAALADLAEKRSVSLETVIDLAAHGELRDLIKDGVVPPTPEDVPEPPQKRERITLGAIKVDERAIESPEDAEKLHDERGVAPVPNSYEAIAQNLVSAIEAWAQDRYGVQWLYVTIDATFPDSVVATIYCSAVDWDGVTYQFPYTVDADDVPTLDEPEQVQLTLTIAEPSDDDARSAEDVEQRGTALSIARARLKLRERQQLRVV